MTVLIFLLTTVVWSPDGSVEHIDAEAFTSEIECAAAGQSFAVDALAQAEASPPAFRGSWHWDCRRVLNDSAGKHV